MAGRADFNDRLVRICIICEGNLPEYYMAIFGCKDINCEYLCSDCDQKSSCSIRLVNPGQDDVTAGICLDCLRDYGI